MGEALEFGARRGAPAAQPPTGELRSAFPRTPEGAPNRGPLRALLLLGEQRMHLSYFNIFFSKRKVTLKNFTVVV